MGNGEIAELMRVAGPDNKRRQAGQSLVELALLLPLLVTFALGIIEGGFLFRNYNALVTATWIGARFALDGGADADVVTSIQNSASGLPIVPDRTDIYIVRGSTDSTGAITTWTVDHAFGNGAAQPKVSQTDIQSQLKNGISGLDSSTYGDVSFAVVEMDFQHHSATGSWVIPVTLPIRSYAIVQLLPPQ